MAAVCEELGRSLGLESLGGSLAGSSVESRLESRVKSDPPSRRESRLERAAQAAVATPPSIHYADYPAEVGKREIRVSDAAARIANALHLHLD